MGVEVVGETPSLVGETPSLMGEFVGETHRVLECTQNHPSHTRESAPEGPNLLVGRGGSA